MQGTAEMLRMVVEGLLLLYNWLVYIMRYILETTLFKGNPALAQKYADAIGILSSISAIYLILLLFETARKILKFILILGWLLLALTLILSTISGA